MDVRWEWKRNGVYVARDPDGAEVAEVKNVIGPGGSSDGWQIVLTRQQRALEDYAPDADEAKAAAEIALRAS